MMAAFWTNHTKFSLFSLSFFLFSFGIYGIFLSVLQVVYMHWLDRRYKCLLLHNVCILARLKLRCVYLYITLSS